MCSPIDGAGAGTGESVSKEELLDRVAQGDMHAFRALYEQFAPRVLGVVKRVLVDFAQSEEVAQEVFLEVWQTASRFCRSKGAAKTWIMTMAHRRAIDRVRASQSRHDRDTRIGLRDCPPEYDNVAEVAEVRLEHAKVTKAMERLTDLQREAIALAYYGGYSHSEVASMLEVPIGTVKTRLRDAMIRLRNEMGVTAC